MNLLFQCFLSWWPMTLPGQRAESHPKHVLLHLNNSQSLKRLESTSLISLILASSSRLRALTSFPRTRYHLPTVLLVLGFVLQPILLKVVTLIFPKWFWSHHQASSPQVNHHHLQDKVFPSARHMKPFTIGCFSSSHWNISPTSSSLPHNPAFSVDLLKHFHNKPHTTFLFFQAYCSHSLNQPLAGMNIWLEATFIDS